MDIMSSTDTQPSTVKAKLFAMSSEWLSQLKTLPTVTPRSHWMPYICLFLYPILVLQVKSGGSAMLGLLLFSGLYMLIKEKAKWDIKPILPLYYCFVFFWLVDFVTAGLAEREPVAGMLSSFTQVHFLLFPFFLSVLEQLKFRWQVFFSGAVVSVLLSALVAVYQLYATRLGRAHGGINAILFANILLVQISSISLYALYEKKKWYWLVVAFGLIPLILSQTRGALLALVPILVVLVVCSLRLGQNALKSRVFLACAVIIFVSGAVFGDRVSPRIEQAYEQAYSYLDGSDRESSIGYRIAMYQGGWELAINNLWSEWGEKMLMPHWLNLPCRITSWTS